MANFKAIYEESGLLGIIPYAFNMTGQGYNFLCDKLKNGEAFWIIYSEENNVPFISVDDVTNYVYFNLFSSSEQAEKLTLQLAANDFHTKVIKIDAAATDSATNLWLQYRDLGITHLKFDDAIWVNIDDLAPKATYDGMLNPKLPIRNAQLNAALYYMLQFIDANIQFNESVAYFWRCFQNSHLYVPIYPRVALKQGETLKNDNIEYHHVTDSNGRTSILAFTDNHFLNAYVQQENLKSEYYTAAYTPDFVHLKTFLEENKEISITLNHYYGDLLLTLELLNEMESITLNQAASTAAN